METVIYYAQQMGITTFVLDGAANDKNYATSLGGMTRGVTPLEIASAYGTFANGGVHMPYVAITKVLDRNGNILEEAHGDGVAVITPESAADLTSMLENVINKGTGRGANINRPAAGKTGTTSDYKDAWFVGYTPDLVAAVWIGNDDGTSTDGIMGGTIPASTWAHFMNQALANVPVHDFDDLVVQRRAVAKPPAPSSPPPREQTTRTHYDDYEPPPPRYRDDAQDYSYNNTTQNDSYNDNTGDTSYNGSSTRDDSTYTEQTYSEPTYSEPTYTEPTYSEPTYEEPTYTESTSSDYDVPSPGDDISKDR